MSHVGGTEVFVGSYKELKEYIGEDVHQTQWENPRIHNPSVKIFDEVMATQEDAREFLSSWEKKLHTDYVLAVPFKSSGDLNSFAEINPEKFKIMRAKAEADLEELKKLQVEEIARLKKQAFITCPSCKSKLNGEVFTKRVPTYYFGHGNICNRSKYGLECGNSWFTFEIDLSNCEPFLCPVCEENTIGGKTYLSKVDRLIKKHQQNVEKIYQEASKQKSRTAWLVSSMHYTG